MKSDSENIKRQKEFVESYKFPKTDVFQNGQFEKDPH